MERQAPNVPRSILAVFIATAAGTIVSAVIEPLAPTDTFVLAYIAPIVIVAIRRGMGWALSTIVASVLVVDLVFVEPVWELTTSGNHGVALAMFAIVSFITSGLAERAQMRAILAERRRRDADLLAELAQALYSATDDAQAMNVATEGLRRALDTPDVSLRAASTELGGGEVAMPLWFENEVIAKMVIPETMTEERTGDLTRISAGLGSLMVAVRRRIVLEAEAAQVEAARRSEATKTTVLRAISHDLRTPLATLRAAADGLRSEGIDEESREELTELVSAASDELIGIVENLLTLARIEVGAVDPHMQWTDVEEVIAAEVARRPQLDAKVEVDDLPVIRTDGVQLGRIIANLLHNAERHGQGSGVTVTATMDGTHVTIAVTDSGPGFRGIDPKTMFDPFTSADGKSGVGLGLTIVKGFVEALGGEVEAVEPADGGARFTVRVPAAVAPDVSEAGPEA